jgi:asparagine synthase (glutamine-hydrolysing)
MCGIAGIVGLADRERSEIAVQKMICALARRGPDSEGMESWDKAVFGHRRLAIFDLSEAGRQPMVSSDRSLGVVFNGAIYNYRELRQELMARGYNFLSTTDTEVLIHGYREWGLDRLVARLRGMFAFGLWDDGIRKLYLVRDRLGVKPLVFAMRNGTLAFASSVRALRFSALTNGLREDAILEFIHRGFLPDSLSIYSGASKVPAASIVEWADGVASTRRYWVPPPPAESSPRSFDEVVEQTEQLLLQSVELRLHADVPIGALLSGGIDSSLICWAVAKLGGNLIAYTIGTPGDPWDETADASRTAEVIGIKHRIMNISPCDTPRANELVSAFAEPFASPSALGMLRVSQAVAPSVKALLTGDGGDDVFLGYPRHRHLWLASQLSHLLPSAVRTKWLTCRAAFPRIGLLRRATALLDYASGDLRAFAGVFNGASRHTLNGLLGERLLSVPPDRHERPLSNVNGRDLLANFLEYEQKSRFVGEYMTKVDGATMHFGLEARSPFLDHYLWEYASSLPFELRLHNGRLKAILRELARRRIGLNVAKRRKTGFRVPVHRWLAGPWRDLAEATFRESILGKEGWISSGSVLKELGKASREGKASDVLWHLFILESWIRYEKDGTA